MFRMAGLVVVGLLMAAGLPFAVYTAAEYWKTSVPGWSAALGGAPAPSDAPPTTGASTTPGYLDGAPLSPRDAAALFLDKAPIDNLGAVLRFDISPDWVLGHWPRVSTGLAQLQLQGYRAPLVTGTAEDDLAGALTYYFDPQQRLQRITFYGVTGDAQKLVSLLSSQYRFSRRILNHPGMMVYEGPAVGREPKSSLRVETAEVVRINEPHRRFQVSLVLERPE